MSTFSLTSRLNLSLSKRLFVLLCTVLASLGLMTAVPASAQQREVPYWATLRAEEVNMRVGPSEAYPIDWVYHRQGLPVKVVRLMQGWRLVQDPDGAQGWIVARLLSPERGAVVIGDGPAEMRSTPNESGLLRWRVEPGVVGKVGDCADGWCEFNASGHRAYIREDRLWGAGEP